MFAFCLHDVISAEDIVVIDMQAFKDNGGKKRTSLGHRALERTVSAFTDCLGLRVYDVATKISCLDHSVAIRPMRRYTKTRSPMRRYTKTLIPPPYMSVT